MLVGRRSGVDIPGSDPQFSVHTNDIGKQVLKVTLFCPTPRAASLQFAITKAYFDWYYRKRTGSNQRAI